MTAQYYSAKQNFLDDIIAELQEYCDITVLSRDKTQFLHYSNERFKYIQLPEKPLSFDDIASSCSLFIGAGGSMTRELAMIGVSTISVYQGDLLEVDKLLISKKIMHYDPALTASKVLTHLANIGNTAPSMELIDTGRSSYQLFKQEINSFAG